MAGFAVLMRGGPFSDGGVLPRHLTPGSNRLGSNEDTFRLDVGALDLLRTIAPLTSCLDVLKYWSTSSRREFAGVGGPTLFTTTSPGTEGSSVRDEGVDLFASRTIVAIQQGLPRGGVS